MGNSDRSANYEGDIKRIEKLRACYAYRNTLFDVIGNAIITAQDNRRYQAQQLLRFLVKCALFIRLGIEREKAFDAKMIAAEQLLVHFRPVTIKFIHRFAVLY